MEVLVSNAGITDDQLLLRMSEESFTSVVNANLTASFRVAKRASRGMLKGRWGRLVFVSSVVGLSGQAGQANYAASKAGLVGIARSLTRELGGRGITANVIAPGPIATDFGGGLVRDVGAVRDHLARAAALGPVDEADDIGRAVVALVSPELAFMTGTRIDVSGGTYL